MIYDIEDIKEDYNKDKKILNATKNRIQYPSKDMEIEYKNI